MKHRNQRFIIAAASMALALTGCVNREEQKLAKETGEIVSNPLVAVQLQPARTQEIREEVIVTGSMTVGDTTNVGAKISGRLVSVLVQEGSVVAAGQLLATQDTTQLQAQLASALASQKVAESQLAQQIRNARLTPGQADAQVKQAEAALRAARANLQKGKNGARPQEIAQAEANVRSASENLRTQKLELERVRKLVQEGAVAQSRLDQQTNLVASAQSQFDSASQTLSLLKEGTRREDLRALEEGVLQAEAGLKQAKVAQELNSLLEDQVRTAKAQVEVARASVRQVQQQIEDANIRAPFAGTVTGKPAQPGTVLAPGAVAVSLVGGAQPYFEAEVPEQDIARLAVGTAVSVQVDALSRTLSGTVGAINPLGSEFGRQFKVRVNVTGETTGLKAGMFARGMVTVRTIPSAVLVPNNSVVRRDGKNFVFTVQGDTAKMLEVRTGLEYGSQIQVEGVSSGTSIVIRGQEALDNGSLVKIEEADKPKEEAKA